MCLDQNWQATQDNSCLHVFSDRPLSFDVISDGMNPSLNGTLSKSLSNDGMAFWADHEPKMNAIISVELDDKILANCEEVEHEVLRTSHSVIGRVSSIERNKLSEEVVVKIAFLRRNSYFVPMTKHEYAVG